MSAVSVKNLSKSFRLYQKEPGLSGSLKSLFHRKFRETKAVDNISFEIEEGELVGFIGPNGAGKTTTLKILSGLLHPTSGQASVLGFVPWQRKRAFQRQFALVMGQKNQLWWDLPAQESFILNKEIYEIADSEYKKTILKLTQLLEIEDLLKIPVRKLSLGQRMKAELVCALLHSPKVLLLDEPSIGLDVVAQEKMRQFVKNYNEEFGSTIILTSHYMGDVLRLCRRVIVINEGKIIFDGPLEKISAKYSKEKLFKLQLEKEIPREEFEKLGKVGQYELPLVTITIPKSEATEKASLILDKFPILDLTIEEPAIEDVIRRFFQRKK